MALAIFDLDNTLIAGDSDHSWGEFLVAEQRVDGHQFQQANDQFYADYIAGNLDMTAYLNSPCARCPRYPWSSCSSCRRNLCSR